MRGWWCVLGVVAWCGPAPGWAAGCRLVLDGVVPLRSVEDGRAVAAAVNADGVKLSLLLDTGAMAVVLDRAAGSKVARDKAIGSLIPGGDDVKHSLEGGFGGLQEGYRTDVAHFRLGNADGPIEAHVVDMGTLTQRAGVDGLLGTQVLDNFDVDLDLVGKQLRLFSAKGVCGKPAVLLDQPIYAVPMFEGRRGVAQHFVDVSINGHSFRALLDSGASGTVLMAHTVAALGLAADRSLGKQGHVTGQGVGGANEMGLARLADISVGPLSFRNVVVGLGSENMQGLDLVLGFDFMRRVHVWFSNSSSTLVMQYPPAASPAVGN